MCHDRNKDSSSSAEELRIIRAEILYRNDKIDGLMMDIADEMKMLKQLLSKESMCSDTVKQEN
ncbi:MAG: hypothetical protein KAS93_02460 [Gammaproteobacteria bacterium]|nr:hypothetical protein [Gammaproteobacteria bacterium]